MLGLYEGVPLTERHDYGALVLPDRAQVTRTASLSLRPGIYEIHFNRLPYALQADTVRVRGATGAPSA